MLTNSEKSTLLNSLTEEQVKDFLSKNASCVRTYEIWNPKDKNNTTYITLRKFTQLPFCNTFPTMSYSIMTRSLQNTSMCLKVTEDLRQEFKIRYKFNIPAPTNRILTVKGLMYYYFSLNNKEIKPFLRGFLDWVLELQKTPNNFKEGIQTNKDYLSTFEFRFNAISQLDSKVVRAFLKTYCPEFLFSKVSNLNKYLISIKKIRELKSVCNERYNLSYVITSPYMNKIQISGVDQSENVSDEVRESIICLQNLGWAVTLNSKSVNNICNSNRQFRNYQLNNDFSGNSRTFLTPEGILFLILSQRNNDRLAKISERFWERFHKKDWKGLAYDDKPQILKVVKK